MTTYNKNWETGLKDYLKNLPDKDLLGDSDLPIVQKEINRRVIEKIRDAAHPDIYITNTLRAEDFAKAMRALGGKKFNDMIKGMNS